MTKPKIRPTDLTLDAKYQAMIASTVLLELSFHRFGDKRRTDLDGVSMETHLSSTGDVEQVEVSEEAFQLSRRLLDLAHVPHGLSQQSIGFGILHRPDQRGRFLEGLRGFDSFVNGDEAAADFEILWNDQNPYLRVFT